MPSRALKKLLQVLSSLGLIIFVLSAFGANQKLNINTASVEQLAEVMKGVGPKKALAIVKYRHQHGPFSSVDELVKVKGIGPVTLKKNRAKIMVDETNCR